MSKATGMTIWDWNSAETALQRLWRSDESKAYGKIADALVRGRKLEEALRAIMALEESAKRAAHG
jgi:hypothetical protein